jgi:hypothetical protein
MEPHQMDAAIAEKIAAAIVNAMASAPQPGIELCGS